MSKDVVVRFKFFRSFLLIGFLANGAAMFFFNPLLSYLVAMVTLVLISGCIRCTNCDKYPFVIKKDFLHIGTPFPERVCSGCGHSFASVPAVSPATSPNKPSNATAAKDDAPH